MISLVTPTFVMINRSRSVSISALIPICQKSSAYQAAELSARLTARGLVHKLSNERLVRLIGFLRVGFGALFVGGGVPVPICVFGAGERYGLPVGRDRDRRHWSCEQRPRRCRRRAADPDPLFIFETDIRTAGSASILISLGIELMGLWRYRDRMRSLKADADSGLLTMSAGSIIDVTLGGFRGLPMRRLGFRKTFLGCVLIAAAGKTIAGHSGKP